ncbi:dimethylsulfonioproprionate lyase family protein [Telmatospirillum siberiense]|uniref:Uncharacterized protein n=1 Tax=Telmatospirillum siberiense TaxID=382514 RepID=A0A2N3PSH8_9PROT|nr:dimethylsulfonioproprionate lyase family protein [Telmatospirillum siberiense]PKU23359.1 hypothetical protein CWS72_17160 [Telmatospirillum siberiense]
MGHRLADLFVLMRDHFAKGLAVPGPVAEETTRVLAHLPDRLRASPHEPVLSPSSHPVALAVARTAEGLPSAWAEALGALAPLLPWRFTYAPRPDAPGLGERMAWAEIIGPAAPVLNDHVGFGLTFIGAETHYLAHRHPAVELYNVVAGTARWNLEGADVARPPGSFVLHPSQAVHAMRTSDEAMLAIYSWSGDIVSPTVYA